MRLSLNLFGQPLDAYAPLAVAAERSGFEAVWLSDHLVTPVEWDPVYPYSSSGRPGSYDGATPLADVWSMLGYLACATSTVMLGTGVYILPLRNPFVTARAAATVQQLSGGRLLLGIGAGWLREEYAAVGESFDDRGARMDEIVGILRRLWTGEPVAHHGAAYRFDAVQLSPAPRPQPPIIVGGLTLPALRRAARIGDGWFAPACSLDEAIAARDILDAERRAVQRDHLPFRIWVRLRDPWNAAERDAFRSAGFGDLVVFPAQLARGGDLSGVADRVAELAGEVTRV